MLGPLLMKDSVGRSGDTCHQGPRSSSRAVPQHPPPQLRPCSKEPRCTAATVIPNTAARSRTGISCTSRMTSTLRDKGGMLRISVCKTLSTSRRPSLPSGSASQIGSLGRRPSTLEIIRIDRSCQAPLTDKHQTLILDNPQQPCRKLRVSLKLVDMPECFPASILRFFFRFAPMVKDGSGQIRTPAAMTLDQFAKGISIALFRQAD